MSRYIYLSLLLFTIVTQESFSQHSSRFVCGLVTSQENGTHLEGVTVKVKGSTTPTSCSGSQQDGAYYVEVSEKDSILIFSLDDYKTQEVKLSASKEYNIQLCPAWTQSPAGTQSQSPKQSQEQSPYFTIESYYRVKWGYADEFIRLWKTNHYPLLKKAREKGDIISIKAETPRFHSGEETRWDFRVTVVFKNVEKAFDEDLVVPYKKELFPDTEALNRSEQHRFELLLAHWDTETAEQQLP